MGQPSRHAKQDRERLSREPIRSQRDRPEARLAPLLQRRPVISTRATHHAHASKAVRRQSGAAHEPQHSVILDGECLGELPSATDDSAWSIPRGSSNMRLPALGSRFDGSSFLRNRRRLSIAGACLLRHRYAGRTCSENCGRSGGHGGRPFVLAEVGEQRFPSANAVREKTACAPCEAGGLGAIRDAAADRGGRRVARRRAARRGHSCRL
jgi:hypothetical protein